MLFGDDDLRKSQIGFCFGSTTTTTNLYFFISFTYEVSRRSSHSNRGSGRFHKGISQFISMCTLTLRCNSQCATE